MRSNRTSYHAAPAGSSRVLDRKPKPKKSKREVNQLMLIMFFMVLPVLGLLAIFFQPVRWLFMILVVIALGMMWMMHAFLFPGRMVVTAVYGLLLVFTLVSALGSRNENDRIAKQQNLFAAMSAQPTTTPMFSYSTMGTNVPDSYYHNEEDPFANTQTVGLSGGSGDESGQDLGFSEAGANAYVATEKSGAEIALENFMEKWRRGIIADMVEYTAPSWQAAQDSPSRQLFWKFAQKPLLEWRQLAAPTGTDASTARTVTVQADISYSGETRTYQYDAVLLFENEKWYVDPNSLSSGTLTTAAPATPDPNATPTPTPAPTPTPTVNPKTKLYYNKDGGSYYHAEAECSLVGKKFLPMASFTYSDLSKSPYNKLKPCSNCGADELN